MRMDLDWFDTWNATILTKDHKLSTENCKHAKSGGPFSPQNIRRNYEGPI